MANLVRGVQVGLTSLLFVLAGCGGGVSVARPSWAGWAERAGGVAPGLEQIRADAALARLGVGGPSIVSVRVLSNDSLGAWTFADGSIFVTHGLARSLSDDELAAVLAHETGHLEAAGRLTSPGVAFDGAAGSADCEQRADDAGRAILKFRGIPEECLITALRKVRNSTSISPFVRAAIDARIRRLTLSSDPMPAGHELLAEIPPTRPGG